MKTVTLNNIAFLFDEKGRPRNVRKRYITGTTFYTHHLGQKRACRAYLQKHEPEAWKAKIQTPSAVVVPVSKKRCLVIWNDANRPVRALTYAKTQLLLNL